MNIAVIAVSPKPAAPPVLALLGLPSRLRYFLLKNIENTMPHMMHKLITRAMVVNASAVISAALRPERPMASAAPCAT